MNKLNALVLKKQREFIENSDKLSIELIGDTWSDDHETCARFNINGTEVDFDWCGIRVVCAVEYHKQSSLAKDHVINFMLNTIEGIIDMAGEWSEMAENDRKLCEVFNVSQEDLIELWKD